MLVLSDIHANLPALEAVLEDADEHDTVLFCGDLVGYYPWPADCIETLQQLDVLGVRGNHDEAMVTDSTFGFNGAAQRALEWQRERLADDDWAYLRELPYTRREQLQGCDVFMVHGSPRRPVQEYVYPEQVTSHFFERQELDVDVLLLGHTHVPFSRTVEDTLVVNPGSVGQPRDGEPGACYATLDLDRCEAALHRVDYDLDRVAAAVDDAGLPRMLAERLRRG